MFEKIKRLFARQQKETGRDRSEHRVHTTKYEDLCQ